MPATKHAPEPPREVRVRLALDPDVWDLLRAECRQSTDGRYYGLKQTIAKCVYATLGRKKRRECPQ
jgi:hypothetical protein